MKTNKMKTNEELFTYSDKTEEDIAYENELKENIKKDDEFVDEIIRPLKMSKEQFDDSLMLFVDTQREFHNCKNCPGLKECKNSCQGFMIHPEITQKLVTKTFKPCRLYEENRNFMKKFLYKDYSDNFNELLLKNINNYRNGYRQQLKIALKEMLDQNLKNWIYIYGPTKSSKSEYLMAFCNEFALKKKGNIAYLNVKDLMEYVKEIFYKDKDEFDEYFDELSSVTLLVLDGFNKDVLINSVIRDQFLLPLINSRYKNNKIVMISSNLDLDGLNNLLAQNRYGADNAYEITSKIFEKRYKKLYKLEHLIM